jgi:hypothetical protein
LVLALSAALLGAMVVHALATQARDVLLLLPAVLVGMALATRGVMEPEELVFEASGVWIPNFFRLNPLRPMVRYVDLAAVETDGERRMVIEECTGRRHVMWVSEPQRAMAVAGIEAIIDYLRTRSDRPATRVVT